jgi:hydrogenase maturation protease
LLRIIGIGSPFSGDQLGLQAVTLLQQETRLSFSPFEVDFLALDRPGSGLIDYFTGAEVVVLIDAMQSGQAVATVQRLNGDELLHQAGLPSSHSLGVAETLALAEALGALPQQLLIYGIEAGEEAVPEYWYPALFALLQQDISTLSGSTLSS